MEVKKIKEYYRRFDAWSRRFDLSKRYPHYIHKWVFRSAMILALLVVALAVYIDGFGVVTGDPYIVCASDVACENALYYCAHPSVFPSGRVCDPKTVSFCESNPVYCEKQFLAPGEVVGHKPSAFTEGAEGLLILIFAGSFLVNHIVYRLKRRNKKNV